MRKPWTKAHSFDKGFHGAIQKELKKMHWCHMKLHGTIKVKLVVIARFWHTSWRFFSGRSCHYCIFGIQVQSIFEQAFTKMHSFDIQVLGFIQVELTIPAKRKQKCLKKHQRRNDSHCTILATNVKELLSENWTILEKNGKKNPKFFWGSSGKKRKLLAYKLNFYIKQNWFEFHLFIFDNDVQAFIQVELNNKARFT